MQRTAKPRRARRLLRSIGAESRSAIPESTILVVNTGSSSLKFGLYTREGGQERLVFDGLADGINTPNAKLELKDRDGKPLRSQSLELASESVALEHAARWMRELFSCEPSAIGHRVVHGGPRLVTHQIITPSLIQELESCLHFAPLHIPIALELIRKCEQIFPNVPQYACFDTAFHTTLPEQASRFPLPQSLFDEGVRRYGFHGLSYESIVYALGADLKPRTVVAHLGSGASLAAVKNGRSVDTTMGLTPTGGIPMATRSGDLDPGVVLYLQRVKNMHLDNVEELLNRAAGLKALSGGQADMRNLESAMKAGDEKARLAIDIFCTSICKVVAAYAAVLGGLDMLVFSGGIGEHSELIRSKVCCGLQFLGVPPDACHVPLHAGTRKDKQGHVSVRVVPSEEDRQIARHCRSMM